LRQSPAIYVYILQCTPEPDRFYTGFTDDLKARLEAHNSGQVPHTSKFKPWRLNTYLAFNDKDRAIAFEKYLKSHSGRTFAKKRL
jgi:predicted GIY-YIG superfamily endonuclease